MAKAHDPATNAVVLHDAPSSMPLGWALLPNRDT
jgi:hypothetical protein